MQGMGMRDCKESSCGTLRLITREAAVREGASSGHRQPGVIARWRLPALGIDKLNWAVAGQRAKQQELLVPRADKALEGQGPGPPRQQEADVRCGPGLGTARM